MNRRDLFKAIAAVPAAVAGVKLAKPLPTWVTYSDADLKRLLAAKAVDWYNDQGYSLVNNSFVGGTDWPPLGLGEEIKRYGPCHTFDYPVQTWDIDAVFENPRRNRQKPA